MASIVTRRSARLASGEESVASTPVASAVPKKVAARRTTGRKPTAAEISGVAENQNENFASPKALQLFQDVIGSARRRVVGMDGKSATNSPAVSSPRRAFGDMTNSTPVQQEAGNPKSAQATPKSAHRPNALASKSPASAMRPLRVMADPPTADENASTPSCTPSKAVDVLADPVEESPTPVEEAPATPVSKAPTTTPTPATTTRRSARQMAAQQQEEALALPTLNQGVDEALDATPAAEELAPVVLGAATPATRKAVKSMVASAMEKAVDLEPANSQDTVLEATPVVLGAATPATKKAVKSLVASAMEKAVDVEETELVFATIAQAFENVLEDAELEEATVEEPLFEDTAELLASLPTEAELENFMQADVTEAAAPALAVEVVSSVECLPVVRQLASLPTEAELEDFMQADVIEAAAPALAVEVVSSVEAPVAPKSPSLRQLRKMCKEATKDNLGRWEGGEPEEFEFEADESYDLADEYSRDLSASNVPTRKLLSEVATVLEHTDKEESGAEGESRLQAETLKQARAAERKVMVKERRNEHKQNKATKAALRDQAQAPATPPQEDEVIYSDEESPAATLQQRVHLRGTEQFDGIHLRFDAQSSMPTKSPGVPAAPYSSPEPVYCEEEDEEPWAAGEEEEWESEDATEESQQTQGPAHLPRRTPLKGQKGSEGMHLRYTEEGDGVPSPTNGAVRLRGVAVATGNKISFASP